VGSRGAVGGTGLEPIEWHPLVVPVYRRCRDRSEQYSTAARSVLTCCSHSLEHVRRTAFGGAARPPGRPLACPRWYARRGRRGSRVKGREAIAQRRRRRP
jgi:hypothetical protein